ncbi:PASTA domain-containing protein [Streptomyces sp. NPDC001920]
MRTRAIAAALAAASLLMLTACEGTNDSSSNKPGPTAEDTNDRTKQDTAPTEADTDPPADDAGAAEPEAETAVLPDLVGQDLQAAQDEAQAAGFFVLDDQDASGQKRLQVFDRNWVVCSQEPAPGTHPTDTPVTLFAVKDGEAC